MTDDIDALAIAVGVMEEPPADPVEEARAYYNRAGERLVAVAFGLTVGTGLLWAHMIGVMP